MPRLGRCGSRVEVNVPPWDVALWGTAFLRRQNRLGWNHRRPTVADQRAASASAYEAAVGDGSKHTSRVHGHDYEVCGWS